MLKVFLLALTATSCLAMEGEEEKRIRRIIDAWNLDSECWGRDNMLPYWAKRSQAIKQCAKYGSPDADLSPENPFSALNANQPNPISRLLDQALTNELPTNGDNGWSDLLGGLEREPRQTRPIAAGADDQIQQFLKGFSNHKENTATKLGNLTCVMAELGKVDSKMAINMDYFMNKLWTNIDLSKSMAGEDPIWRGKVTQGFTDCYNLATSWPQAVLDRHPVKKVMGRYHVFFTCAKKVMRKYCIKALEHDWLHANGDSSDSLDWEALNLPMDKYDRASLKVLMMQESATKEERFITDFFTEDGKY